MSAMAQQALEERGHVDLMQIPFRLGDANSVMRVGEELVGVADPRNAGAHKGDILCIALARRHQRIVLCAAKASTQTCPRSPAQAVRFPA